jgi:HEPN domain-containing protein
MNPLTDEWIAKAEGDLRTAEREIQADEGPNYDAVCFHAQQCAEKYLKARLVEAGVSFPKTHDLGALLDLVLPVEPAWEDLRGELNSLTDQAVEVRYPGLFSEKEDAEGSLTIARRVRQVVRQALGLS